MLHMYPKLRNIHPYEIQRLVQKRWINVIHEHTKKTEGKPSFEHETPEVLYRRFVNNGVLKVDSDQELVVLKLNELHSRLSNYEEPSVGGFLSSLFSSRSASSAPRGIYIYGSVGCGKTMLMDMFYETVKMKKKRRIHFNTFMLDVHQKIHTVKKNAPRMRYYDKGIQALDPLPPVAKEIRKETTLLCFDEFQVTDVADAMILKRLFTCLFEEGIIVVSTSNRQPKDLYKNGLQRVNFVPFIPVLESFCEVLHLKSVIDYRRLDLSSLGSSYYLTTDKNTTSKMEMLFHLLCENEEEAGHMLGKKTLNVLGRQLLVNQACGGVARFNFQELCSRALGAVDYIAISKTFHTVLIENIPVLSAHEKPELRRFITMIDNFYEYKLRVICSAAKPMNELFQKSNQINIDYNRQLMDDLGIKLSTDVNASASLFTSEEENFAMERTLSRLSEMQTEQYWNASNDQMSV